MPYRLHDTAEILMLNIINAMIFYEVTKFVPDMINMMRLEYVPLCCEWIHCPGDAIPALAV
jgi:hypothetical protein